MNPVLSVAKAFAPTTVAAGTDTRMTITLTRAAGAVALTGLAFTDTLPAGHVVSATPNLVNNCGGAVTATSGANTVSLAGGGLLGGACGDELHDTGQHHDAGGRRLRRRIRSPRAR